MRTEMNKNENLKATVIESCINGTMTVKVAAQRLNFSERYVKKLKARYKKYGASSMMHGNCGKQPKHTITADIKSKIWEIWNLPELEECNFTHFQEILEEDYDKRRKVARTQVYYAHSYRSGERGSNKNANRLIRRFIPKGIDITPTSEEYIQKIEDWINNYPRAMFKYKSTNEILRELCA